MIVKPTTLAAAIERTANHLGAKIPAPVAQAMQLHTAATAAIGATAPHGAQLVTAYLEAIEADRDPLTDPAVIAAATADQLAERRPALAAEVDARATRRIVAATDAITKALAPGFAKVTTALTEAHAELGDVDLNDHATILHQRNQAPQAWAQAVDACTIVEATVHLYALLRQAAGYNDPALPSVLRVCTTPPGWEKPKRGRPSAWELQKLGATFALADDATLAQRLDDYHRSLTDARRTAQEAAATATKRAPYATW